MRGVREACERVSTRSGVRECQSDAGFVGAASSVSVSVCLGTRLGSSTSNPCWWCRQFFALCGSGVVGRLGRREVDRGVVWGVRTVCLLQSMRLVFGVLCVFESAGKAGWRCYCYNAVLVLV